MKQLWALALAPTLLLSGMALPADLAEAQSPDRSGHRAARYNFPPASRGDRFARNGPSMKVGIQGWRKYGPLIKRVAAEQRIDPYILGAYVWVESKFDPRQDYSANGKRALGLGSVQATDHRKYSPEKLKEPYLNLTITAKEFRSRWKPNDMFGTVMDVWYPNWRRKVAIGKHIPVVKTPHVYVQAIANRYYALKEIDSRLHSR
jgi:soluble lytic murein transglycosylase-like protein